MNREKRVVTRDHRRKPIIIIIFTRRIDPENGRRSNNYNNL